MTTYPIPPACAESCRRVLISLMAQLGVEATATWLDPLCSSAYEPLNMRCPHGVEWHLEPTSEQRIRYAAEDPEIVA